MNQNDWKPIETAPMENEWILGYYKSLGCRICIRFEQSDLWWILGASQDTIGDHQPTHWMPLPKGPE